MVAEKTVMHDMEDTGLETVDIGLIWQMLDQGRGMAIAGLGTVKAKSKRPKAEKEKQGNTQEIKSRQK